MTCTAGNGAAVDVDDDDAVPNAGGADTPLSTAVAEVVVAAAAQGTLA